MGCETCITFQASKLIAGDTSMEETVLTQARDLVMEAEYGYCAGPIGAECRNQLLTEQLVEFTGSMVKRRPEEAVEPAPSDVSERDEHGRYRYDLPTQPTPRVTKKVLFRWGIKRKSFGPEIRPRKPWDTRSDGPITIVNDDGSVETHAKSKYWFDFERDTWSTILEGRQPIPSHFYTGKWVTKEYRYEDRS